MQIKWQLFGIGSPKTAFFSISPYKCVSRNSRHKLDHCQQNGSTCVLLSVPFRHPLGETWGDQWTARPRPGYQPATYRLGVRHYARWLHIFIMVNYETFRVFVSFNTPWFRPISAYNGEESGTFSDNFYLYCM
jgi:hypothetical protein